MNTATRPERRRWILPGLIGLGLGVGLSGLLAYVFVGPRASAFAPGMLGAAGRLPKPAARPAVDDPDALRRDEQALAAANGILDALAKQDAAAMAARCGSPFLWGRVDKHRVVENPAEIQRCLSEDLLFAWEPLMYEPERSLSLPLSPSAFFHQWADHLAGIPGRREGLDAIHWEETDRMIVDDRRGMLIGVRTGAQSAPAENGTAQSPRVIALVVGDFRPPPFKLTRDIIYGRKFGVALTLDLIQPKTGGNRAAVLELIGDTFASHPPQIANRLHAREQGLIDRGYTLIYVTHSSVPRNPIPEIVGDVRRAVRYIRFHAAQLDLDPDKISVLGGSACGYLALMAGTSDDDIQPFPPKSDPVRLGDLPADPVESVSGKASAIVAYFPVTDFVNFGETGKTVFDGGGLPTPGILDLYDYDDKTMGYTRISDRAEQLRRLKTLSPVNRVGRGFPPTLLFHGAKDTHVPVQQSESMARALKAAGVDVEVVIKPNEEHGWSDNAADQKTLVEWLDRRLFSKGQ
jgi:acetyl esterase/lipase